MPCSSSVRSILLLTVRSNHFEKAMRFLKEAIKKEKHDKKE